MARKANPQVKHAALDVLASLYDLAERYDQIELAMDMQGVKPGEYGYDDEDMFMTDIKEYIEAILEGEFDQRTSTL